MEIIRLINESVHYLEDNEYMQLIVQDWMNSGDPTYDLLNQSSRNVGRFREICESHSYGCINRYLKIYGDIVEMIKFSNIQTHMPISLYIQMTNQFHYNRGLIKATINKQEVFFNELNRSSFKQTDNTFNLIIPTHTPIFYISAIDLINNNIPFSFDLLHSQFNSKFEFLLLPSNLKKINETDIIYQ